MYIKQTKREVFKKVTFNESVEIKDIINYIFIKLERKFPNYFFTKIEGSDKNITSFGTTKPKGIPITLFNKILVYLEYAYLLRFKKTITGEIFFIKKNNEIVMYDYFKHITKSGETFGNCTLSPKRLRERITYYNKRNIFKNPKGELLKKEDCPILVFDKDEKELSKKIKKEIKSNVPKILANLDEVDFLSDVDMFLSFLTKKASESPIINLNDIDYEL